MYQKNSIQSYFWLIAAALATAIVYNFFSITMYVAISVVIMLISDPLINKLNNITIAKRTLQIPRALSATLILLLFLAIISAIILSFIPLINQQINSLSYIDITLLKDNFYHLIDKLDKIFQSLYPNDHRNVLEFFQEKILSIFNPKNIADTLSNTLLFTGNIFIALFSIIFISFFLIKDKELIKEKIFLLIPDAEKHSVSTIIKNCKETLSRYFIGLFIQVICIFTCNFIGLSAMGIKNALLIATISAILNIIPYIGPLMGMVFAFFIVTASYLSPEFSLANIYLKTYIIMFGTQLLDNFVFQPLIFSRSIKAHPLEIFLVVIAAGTIYGVLGMLIAIPAYSVIRITAKQILKDQRKR
ncbi:MAG: AI-2E family transporter [Bacteroidia bacterium]